MLHANLFADLTSILECVNSLTVKTTVVTKDPRNGLANHFSRVTIAKAQRDMSDRQVK